MALNQDNYCRGLQKDVRRENIILNLRIIEKDDSQTKTSDNIKNDPKCLLVKNKEGKISRNERCEATGKKFKNCCGAL